MARIVGDSPNYRFALMRLVEVKDGVHAWRATDYTFDLPSVSRIKEETLGIPSGAMAWHGYRIAIAGMAEMFGDTDAVADALDNHDAKTIEAVLRERGCDPNKALSETADRGAEAHDVLELLANEKRTQAEKLAAKETKERGTLYGQAVINAWDQEYAPYIANGSILEIRTELPVWSLKWGFGGQFDLAVHWIAGNEMSNRPQGWSIDDLKTHKPADGFTKPGRGPAYLSDVVQARFYRMAWEEMGLGPTVGNRIIIARGEGTKTAGKFVMDDREVPEALCRGLLELREHKLAFEEGTDG